MTPKERKSIVDAYCALQEAEENYVKVERHVTPRLNELVKSLNIQDDLTGEDILTHEDMVWAGQKDKDRFAEASHELYLSLGYDVVKNGSPVLKAKTRQAWAEKAFIEASYAAHTAEDAAIFKRGADRDLVRRAEYIEIMKRYASLLMEDEAA